MKLESAKLHSADSKREWPINNLYIQQKVDNQMEMWSCHQSVVCFGEGRRPLAWHCGLQGQTPPVPQAGLTLMDYLHVSFTLSKPQLSNRMHPPHLTYKQLFIPNHVLHLSYHNPIFREQVCAACYGHWAAIIHLEIMGWREICWLSPVWNHVSGSL